MGYGHSIWTWYMDIDELALWVMDIDELALWVMEINRRLIVMKTVKHNDVISASDIAIKTGRSLQNISYALRELEKYELIRCITPDKSTWKRFIFTEKGIKVFEKLRKPV